MINYEEMKSKVENKNKLYVSADNRWLGMYFRVNIVRSRTLK